jgi:hypothetical protein
MSGPYPPSGYPQQPAPGNWPGGQPTGGPGDWSGGHPGAGDWSGGGQQSQPTGGPGDWRAGAQQQGQPGQPVQPGQPGGFGPQTFEFPSVPYGGLSGGSGGWGGEPPRRKRSIGRILVAVISVLIIIGGVAVIFVVLSGPKHQQQTAAPSGGAAATTTTAPAATGSSGATTTPPSAEGTTTLTLTAGQCATASVTADAYAITKQAVCGAADSDLVLAKAVADLAGCESHQYLAIQATSGVYCFTLDLKQGDCLDNNYLKTPCASAAFTVLSTETGPGSTNSCATAAGATHWVPTGVNPVKVACIGPPKA